jgi:hypothetical protein
MYVVQGTEEAKDQYFGDMGLGAVTFMDQSFEHEIMAIFLSVGYHQRCFSIETIQHGVGL